MKSQQNHSVTEEQVQTKSIPFDLPKIDLELSPQGVDLSASPLDPTRRL